VKYLQQVYYRKQSNHLELAQNETFSGLGFGFIAYEDFKTFGMLCGLKKQIKR
jgi:hypothetical protein